MEECAITRRVVVAAGRFAPGHLGELTQQVPFEMVDAVLAETGRVQSRVRDLPARVVVYLLAAGLFAEVGYPQVFTTEDGAPLHPDFLTRRFRALVGESGLPPIRLHDLRHGAAEATARLILAAGRVVDVGVMVRVRKGPAPVRPTGRPRVS